MSFWLNALLFALHCCPVAYAQTYPDLLSQPTETLVVSYQGQILKAPGDTLAISDTLLPPAVGLASDDHPGPYVFLMVDASDGSSGSSTSTILHTLQSDLYLASSPTTVGDMAFFKLASDSAPIAPYLAPLPLVGSSVHRYVLLLFAQPDGFSVPEEYLGYMPNLLVNRLGFPLEKFVTVSGLGVRVAGTDFEETLSHIL